MSLKGVNYVFYAIALLNSRIEKKSSTAKAEKTQDSQWLFRQIFY